MEGKKKLRLFVYISVASFGILATIFAIVAEVKHVKAHEVVVIGDDCFYPSNPAWAFGLLAASCLLIAQIIANACGGCVCCCMRHQSAHAYSPNSSNNAKYRKALATLCLVLSWITFANAFFLLLEGAALNGQQQYGQGLVHSCYIIKPGVFAAGAALSTFTAILAIIYYTMASFEPLNGSVSYANNNSFGNPSFSAHQLPSSFGLHSNRTPPFAYIAGFELPKRFQGLEI